jgi:protein-L-isoaspartate(D-aspartate) O-methyltransferase
MMRALLTIVTALTLTTVAIGERDYAGERRQMIEEIKEMAADTGVASFDARVLAALEKVPRHEFVPRDLEAAAYKNRPLPIGHGQTISQPFIVALMTDLLQTKDTDKVLEIGTGSGYQAAILSLLVREVFSIEIIPELGEAAGKVLKRLGYTNVQVKIGDGYQGWAEYAPFDAIIVTAAPAHIPPMLIEQLKPNGRMVIPVGDLFQELMLVTKNPDGTTTSTTIVPVRFVPLIRE